MCLIERKIGNYESALNVIKNAVDIARNIIDEVGTDDIDAFAAAIEIYAICLMNQGIVYDQQERYASAIPIYRKAKETFEEALPLFQENFDGSKELDERYHAIMSILESINENLQ